VTRAAIGAVRVIALAGGVLWAWNGVEWLVSDVDPAEPVRGWNLVVRVFFSLALSVSLAVGALGLDLRRLTPLVWLPLAWALWDWVSPPYARLPLLWALGTFALYFATMGLPALAAGWLLLRDRRERKVPRVIDGAQVVE
jgi:hypothetical protein